MLLKYAYIVIMLFSKTHVPNQIPTRQMIWFLVYPSHWRNQLIHWHSIVPSWRDWTQTNQLLCSGKHKLSITIDPDPGKSAKNNQRSPRYLSIKPCVFPSRCKKRSHQWCYFKRVFLPPSKKQDGPLCSKCRLSSNGGLTNIL